MWLLTRHEQPSEKHTYKYCLGRFHNQQPYWRPTSWMRGCDSVTDVSYTRHRVNTQLKCEKRITLRFWHADTSRGVTERKPHRHSVKFITVWRFYTHTRRVKGKVRCCAHTEAKRGILYNTKWGKELQAEGEGHIITAGPWRGPDVTEWHTRRHISPRWMTKYWQGHF